MNPHLRVSNSDVQYVIDILISEGWLSNNLRIHESENHDFRLIPLGPMCPAKLPPPLDNYPISMKEGVPDSRKRPDWSTILRGKIGTDVLSKYEPFWPKSHEIIGDIMILKIEAEVRQFREEISESMLLAHPKLRVVLEDRGVMGTYRIRDTLPLAVRSGRDLLLGTKINEVRSKVDVKESGCIITCDPVTAYYSSRLQTERIHTADEAEELRDQIGNSINVADPFCGVGPALAHLVNRPGLVNSLLASDINPNAVKLLNENLSRWTKKKIDPEVTAFTKWDGNLWSGVEDANNLPLKKDLRGIWNLLIINLPHSFTTCLAPLLPLMDFEKPSLIRGRLVCKSDDLENIRSSISDLLPAYSDVKINPRNDYSPSVKLCSVTIRTSG